MLRLVSLLHEPDGCAQLAFCQKRHGQGFCAGFVCFGASEVTRSGVADGAATGAAVSSGIASSVCAAIVYI